MSKDKKELLAFAMLVLDGYDGRRRPNSAEKGAWKVICEHGDQDAVNAASIKIVREMTQAPVELLDAGEAAMSGGRLFDLTEEEWPAEISESERSVP